MAEGGGEGSLMGFIGARDCDKQITGPIRAGVAREDQEARVEGEVTLG